MTNATPNGALFDYDGTSRLFKQIKLADYEDEKVQMQLG